MMHGRNMLNQETLKPRNLSETLGRLGKYFGRFWYMIVLAVFFVVVSTWTQVTSPELMGQATDCFLVPAGSSAFAQLAPPTDSAQETVSSCWLGTTEDPPRYPIRARSSTKPIILADTQPQILQQPRMMSVSWACSA